MQARIHRRRAPRVLIAAAAFAFIGATAPGAVAQGRPAIPTPESVFGFKVGADSQLIDYDQSINYFRKLAAASPRMKLIEVGKTSNGKPWTVVLMSSPQNLAQIERLKQINQRIAHPEGLTDSAARALARQGKMFVDISGGLHASEIAGSQHTPQLAYELLARANEPEIREIFDNVVFILWPSINPDGQDIVVKWCRDTYAGRNPAPMELYQKYIGHDNNRDSYMLNVVESRVIQKVWREWEPNIIYVHHQSSPEPTRMWIPPFADPVGLRAPPIPARIINTIGMYIAQELDANNQPGGVHALATFDAYYPGYIDYMPVYQNIPAWWTETQGGSCATPKAVGRPENFSADYRALEPRALYLSPWTGGPWTLRSAVDYMVTASRATLKFASKFREELLYNRYQSGRDVIRKYRNGPPYAYIVSQQQHDPMAPVELLRRFAFHGIRISQLDRDATLGGVTYAKGSWVVPMDQEFAELVREVWEVQKYPDMGDDLPYDAAGWTLPFQMNVKVTEATQPLTAEFRAAMKPVRGTPEPWGKSADFPFTTNVVAAGIVPATSGITGSGTHVLLDPAQNNSFRFVTRALTAGATVSYVANSRGAARWAVSGLAADRADALASELSVTAERVAALPAALKAPTRVALYKAAPGNMDQGWTEWLFDTHGYQYSLIG
ncbi:MAG: M14 family metallopeptidase, partial [Gemmatimonadota bacterium]|nr:M14 family metallopeptidase [Gemmatimonadota bacterium]